MYTDALYHLRSSDPIMATIIEIVGSCTLKPEKNVFKSLTESILYQQLSLKAAQSIINRFLSLFPKRDFPRPSDVLSIPDKRLQQAGLSRQKTRYIKDLSQKMIDMILTPEHFPTMSDNDIINQLLKVKGIGQWTAQMFLIFSLCRHDVLPIDDLGLKKAVRKWYKFDNDPTAGEITEVARSWVPYRSIATWYLWQSMKTS